MRMTLRLTTLHLTGLAALVDSTYCIFCRAADKSPPSFHFQSIDKWHFLPQALFYPTHHFHRKSLELARCNDRFLSREFLTP
jgi:hypothetical protein